MKRPRLAALSGFAEDEHILPCRVEGLVDTTRRDMTGQAG